VILEGVKVEDFRLSEDKEWLRRNIQWVAGSSPVTTLSLFVSFKSLRLIGTFN